MSSVLKSRKSVWPKELKLIQLGFSLAANDLSEFKVLKDFHKKVVVPLEACQIRPAGHGRGVVEQLKINDNKKE